jgi:small subunit ribosomal protein S19e
LPTPYDVPAPIFIDTLAQHLKNNVDEIVPPPWSAFVKTGAHVERRPQNPDWWFTRCSSLLRKIYMKGPIGVTHLRAQYGGRKDGGVKPEHVGMGGGAIIRKAIQQLETAGLVESSGNKGRVLTKEGRQLLDSLSTEIKEKLEKKRVKKQKK